MLQVGLQSATTNPTIWSSDYLRWIRREIEVQVCNVISCCLSPLESRRVVYTPIRSGSEVQMNDLQSEFGSGL